METKKINSKLERNKINKKTRRVHSGVDYKYKTQIIPDAK